MSTDAAATWGNWRPWRNVRLPRRPPGEMYGYPAGLRSLHFCGRRPIPRLPELASNCVRPAAALRDYTLLRVIFSKTVTLTTHTAEVSGINSEEYRLSFTSRRDLTGREFKHLNFVNFSG